MQRIILIKNQLNNYNSEQTGIEKNPSSKGKPIKGKKLRQYVNSAYDYLEFDDFLTPKEKEFRLKLRNYLEELQPKLNEFYEKQEFPVEIVKRFLADFPGLIAMHIKGYGSAEISFWFGVAVLLEIARVDASLFTFFMIHGGKLNMNVINLFGSEEQKAFYLPKMISGEIISSFCLTEPCFGSDAASIETHVSELDKDYLLLNGTKRWIGNASLAGVLIVWAKNSQTKQIEGFLVDASLPGVIIKKMLTKLSLRSVQNCDIEFNTVKIPKSSRLPKAGNFQESVTKALLFSRLGVSWGAVGMSIGVYDYAVKYCSERIQFGKKLVSFQITQEKLARLLGNIQAMMFYCKRLSEIYLKGKATAGNIGMLKAWITKKGRENVSLGRELLGGNGILLENIVMKHFLDMEVLFTYEGTYDINMLVAGKEITGVNALR